MANVEKQMSSFITAVGIYGKFLYIYYNCIFKQKMTTAMSSVTVKNNTNITFEQNKVP